jgi:hypothetical protein
MGCDVNFMEGSRRGEREKKRKSRKFIRRARGRKILGHRELGESISTEKTMFNKGLIRKEISRTRYVDKR